MNKKGLTIWLFVSVLGLSCIVNAGPNADPNAVAPADANSIADADPNAGVVRQQLSQTSPEQQEKLHAIDKSVSESRRRIENRYSKMIEELRQQADRQFEQFEAAQKDAFAGSAVSTETFYERLGYVPKGYSQNENGFWLADGRLEQMQKTIADKKSQIYQTLQADIDRLKSQQEYLLNVGLKDLKERLREDIVAPGPQQLLGTLCGTVHVEEKRAALINRTIVREGDTVYSVNIVRIELGRVEFEKNGITWQQSVGAAPAALWK